MLWYSKISQIHVVANYCKKLLVPLITNTTDRLIANVGSNSIYMMFIHSTPNLDCEYHGTLIVSTRTGHL